MTWLVALPGCTVAVMMIGIPTIAVCGSCGRLWVMPVTSTCGMPSTVIWWVIVKFWPGATPFATVAVTVTTPAFGTLSVLPVTLAPAPDALHVMVWFVAFAGTTVPDKVICVPAVPVDGRLWLMPVTGTGAGSIVIW